MLKISFVIPTINRPQELKRLLDSFVYQSLKPNEVIIIDQGKGFYNSIISQFHDFFDIKYYNVDFQSLTKARNFGVQKAIGDIIGFLDDDIILNKDYVRNILSFFECHLEAKGVQGVITNFVAGHTKKVGGNKMIYFLYSLFAKVFFLNNSSSKNKLLLSGRNQYAVNVKSVRECQWLSGIGNYRREVFSEFLFDENLCGYAFGEDKLFSYRIFQKYPQSLFIDPGIKCEHYHPQDDLGKSQEWVKMKIKYTYYLWQKLFKWRGFLAYFSYVWANFGDLLIVFFSVILRQNKFKFFKWHLCEYFKLLWKKN